ncbi:MAG: tryptophan synthase subunit alpha [Richelia sp.]|nr:tryptophan synthase subunit alpha [Richelia sp.]
MAAISDCFAKLKQNQQCALIPFITAGDPNLETTPLALQALARNGADMIELGVPYSDPLADGPVIQAAATRALEKGTTLDKVLAMLKQVIPSLNTPIILFTYYNPILNRGIEPFLRQIAEIGVAGLVVPDLPLEEAANLLEPAQKIGIEVILLIAPTSSSERMAAIARASQGFIYLVSVTGVTGMRTKIQSRVSDLILQLRDLTDKSIGVGFGISKPEQAKQVKDWGADGVIVGSAIVKQLAQGTPEQGVNAIATYCGQLKDALSKY